MNCGQLVIILQPKKVVVCIHGMIYTLPVLFLLMKQVSSYNLLGQNRNKQAFAALNSNGEVTCWGAAVGLGCRRC
jgi:hypothetical protein